jgi:hypothetical protein
MAGNWMDDRERAIRERDGRGLGDGPRISREEDRTWERDDEVFGVRQSGVSYGRANEHPYRQGSAARGWQDRNYGGVSPGMREGGGYGRGRFQGGDYAAQDYRSGGRFYGDDSQGRIYREQYGQGGVDYGDMASGYDDGAYSPTRARYHADGYGRPGYGGYPGEFRSNRMASGGTGGYDYERGYGDGGRGESRSGESRGDRFEDAGRSAGEFLHRAGERMAHWFGAGSESRIYDPDYLNPNPNATRGARGLGPQGYKRSDERISDEAHERLTDDTWLDASDIGVSVSGGEITLSGTVQSREAKHRAEHLVEELSGVTHVQNNLRLAKGNPLTSAGRGYGDSVLGAQIRAADREDDPVANGTGGVGGGQSTAGRKN